MDLVPTSRWRHVPTQENLTDLLCRSVPATKLTSLSLWWQGPPWLKSQPEQWPTQQLAVRQKLPETRTTVTIFTASSPSKFELWERYSSFEHLVRILASMRWFIHNAKSSIASQLYSPYLTSKETLSAKKFLLRKAQEQSFEEAFRVCFQGKSLSKSVSKENLYPSLTLYCGLMYPSTLIISSKLVVEFEIQSTLKFPRI